MTAPQKMHSDIMVFDRLQRRQITRINLEAHGFLHDWAARQLQDRLQDIKRNFTRQLNMTRTDFVFNYAPDQRICLNMDEEYWPFKAQSLDLVCSNLILHSVNDLPGVLRQIKQALKPDGLFIAALFGGETLHELRESLARAELKTRGGVSPRVFPFADKQQMGALMQRAGFALPVIDSDIITVTYDHMFKLMHDLRGMGERNIINARDKRNPGKALFMEAAQHYQQHFSEPGGRIKATFEMIFLLGWAPHENQQKPLKPGSATTHLTDVL